MANLLFLVTVLTSSPCQCQPPTISPVSDAVDVPTNVQVRTWWGPLTADDVLLEEASSGDPVPFDAEPLGTINPFLALTPVTELEPATEYRVTIEHPAGDTTWSYFTTGAGPDTTPPSLAGAGLADHVLGGACTDHVIDTPMAVVSLDAPADDVAPVGYGGGFVRVTFTDAGGAVETVVLPENNVFLGDTSPEECLNNIGWPVADGTGITAAVLDWSGNASAEIELVAGDVPAGDDDDDGGGGDCTCRLGAAADHGGWSAVALPALLVWLRYRRG